MRKRIITLLCAASVALSAQVAARVHLRPDAPDRYVVQSGDTLWSIAGKYLYNPWNWSELWGMNRSDVRNPQKIYPGQVLRLNRTGGGAVLGFDNAGGNIPTVKLTPRVRDTSVGYGISTLNVNFYKMFMQHPQVINELETKNAPKIVAGPDNRLMYSPGDRIYADRQLEPGKYIIYRAVQDVLDPDTKKYLGQLVIYAGEAQTLDAPNTALASRSARDAAELPDDEYYTRRLSVFKIPTQTAQPMAVTAAVSEVRKGDSLLKITTEKDPFQMTPHAPEIPVNGKIVSVLEGVNEAGPYQSVVLNKGTAEGVDEGTVLSIYRRSRQIKADVPKGADDRSTVIKYLSIPAEEIGLAMVYRTSEHLSSALILKAVTNAKVGDALMNPGHDLDDVPNDGINSPNVPEDPHEAPWHQFDYRTNINVTR